MTYRSVKLPKERSNARNRFAFSVRGQKTVILSKDELAKELRALRDR